MLKMFDNNFYITIIILVCLIIFFVPHKNENVYEEQLITIQKNLLKLQGIQSNNIKVEELKRQFQEEKSIIIEEYEKQKKKTGEVLEEIGHLKTTLEKTRQLSVNSDKIYKKDTQDKKIWYFFKKITIMNEEGKEIPIAWAMFHPFQTSDKQWKVGTYDTNLDIKIIETENADGTYNRYAEANYENRKGDKLPVEITKLDWAIVEKKYKQFYFWNPRLGLGTNFSDAAGHNLNLSLMSYGRTKRDMDWRFLVFGAGINNKELSLSLEPLSWNIGNVIPIIDNMFVGPFLDYDLTDQLKYGIQTSIPF